MLDQAGPAACCRSDKETVTCIHGTFMSSSASCTDEQAYHSNGFRMTQLAPQGAAAGDPSRKFSF